ncbi:MAG TPA: hypothetical protein VGR51_03345, partial [Thermoplasmata archaeon]|nr:hypothetical protein [Thermoplasmata archaeon]
RVSMEQMTPEQWDVFATSWRMNIDTWIPNQQPFFTFAALFSYYTYFRWKHGPKVFAPIMKIAKFPFGSPWGRLPPKFPLKADGGIDPQYCREDESAVAKASPIQALPLLQEGRAVQPEQYAR